MRTTNNYIMRRKKRRASAATRYRNRVLWTSLIAAAVVLCLLITVNSSLKLPFFPTWESIYSDLGLHSPPLPDGQLRVTVLDVGNADSILLESGGKFALIDAGEDNDETDVIACLENAGVTELEYVIATHPDTDHVGGMDAVIRHFPIRTFLMSFMPKGYTPTTRTYENLLDALSERELTPVKAVYEDSYIFGNATLTILSGFREYTETNDQSVICQVSHGEMDFLFMGDAGKEVEQDLLKIRPLLDVEVLKVGHHGSQSSSNGSFIRCVSPEIAVITCGYNNPYRHPHTETLKTLQRNEARIYRTDLSGRIVLTSDGKSVSVSTEKEAQ